MKNIPVSLIVLFSVFFSNAQTKLFTVVPGKPDEAREATLLKIDPQQLKSIVERQADELILEIPYNGASVSVSLKKNEPLRAGFHLDTDQQKNVSYTPGLYYKGKNASMNFFDGEMNGIISIPNVGNLVIGPYKKNYIIYNDASLSILNGFDCKVIDPDPAQLPVQAANKTTFTSRCASVYLEVDYGLYQSKGSNLTNTTNFVTSMFNNVQTLFANSGISIALKSVFVWTSADPYTGSTASAQLQLFHQNRPSFDGDLGQLIGYDSGMKGGVADAVMGVCSPSKYSYVDVDPGFNVIPVYSWSVQGMAHELGHLLGSPHTHACAWNGNNTPIDGCGTSVGYVEGNCGQGPIPTGVGGTIMSYCHVVGGVGVNFANGFGSQPTQRILTTMSGATCLSTDCQTPAPVPACVNGVASVTVGTQTSNSLAFTWTDTSAATSWQVGVFTMSGSGSYSTVTTKSFTKTGLSANTFYKIRIKPVCASGQTVTHKEFISVTSASFCGLTIADSGGSSGVYTANENYTRVLTPTSGKKIKLTFSAFNLQNNKDFLYVYNGSGTSSLIGTYTGTTLPAAITSTASDGVLTLRFKSDGSTQSAGFVASVSCVTVSTTPVVTCTTNTTWNGSSWSNGLPGQTKSAIINGNYTAGTAFTCCNLIINSGKTLTINGGSSVTVVNNITINGNLVVKDKGQLIQISDSGVNTGTGKFSRTTPYVKANDYLYWSSPTANTTLGTGLYGWYNHATFTTPNFIDVKTINAQGVTTANVPDGIDDNNNVWTAQSTSTVMAKGVGYVARNPTTGTKTKDFVGTPNNGIINVMLYNSGSTANRNYNLVGNPYPSAINASTLIQANPGTTGVLYFWTHKTAATGTAPGGVPGDYASVSDFSAYSLTGGVASESGSAVPNGVISSHQAFFVDKTTATSFTFNNSMRSAALANSNFLRTRQLDRIWVSVKGDDELFRQTLIGYLPDTDLSEEWGYDTKMPQARAVADFYSLIDGEAFLTQSRGDFHQDDEVAMGFTTKQEGTFSIQLDQKEGVIADVYLFDALENTWQSLEAPYEFYSQAGTFNERFRIAYKPGAEISNETSSEGAVEPVRVYPNPTRGLIHISGKFERAELFDLSGKLLKTTSEETVELSDLLPGIYLLRIDGQKTIKVIRS